jgi:UDP-N-acetylmuramate: L-alanyl-gamma-D-glutamyl-meso-diaminopimelate ligase
MQVVGTWKGATVIDDFGHHPTAIKETLSALFSRYSGRRIVACFEPRSNTTTRAFFQNELVGCFKGVSALGLGALDRPQRYSESERLDTERIIREVGVPGFAISLDQGSQKNWGEYLYAWLEKTVEPDDVVVLFSNGDFGGLRTLLVRNLS